MADCSWAKTAPMSAGRGLPRMHQTRFTWRSRTRMAPLTITDGRIAMVSCRPPRLCSINPVGGPGDDLCSGPPISPPFPACIPLVKATDVPVKPVLAFPPQAITAPIALEPADVAAVGLDFAPGVFVGGVVKKGAALISREGDFGFSAANGDPEAGHDIELVNFSGP